MGSRGNSVHVSWTVLEFHDWGGVTMLGTEPEISPMADPLDGERYEICPICDEGPRILIIDMNEIRCCVDCAAGEEIVDDDGRNEVR